MGYETWDMRSRISDFGFRIWIIFEPSIAMPIDSPSRILHTARLVLRPICDDDLPFVFRGFSEPEMTRYYGIQYETLEATKAQMDWYRQLEDKGTGRWWAICLRDTEVFAGAVGFNNISPDRHRGEVGYWLFPEHQGKGYMSEALTEALGFAFQNMVHHRISAEVETENTASFKLLNHLGFTFEGTLRECERKDGQFISLEIWSVLKQEWEKSSP